jgi:FixJ family two-component response regulator
MTTLKVLLVDDSPHDRGMVRRELRQEFPDIQFQEVTNESEFGQALSSATFDIVITDYQIRWTDGLRVLNAIRERWPNCPVLMFTATGGEEVAVEAMKAGLNDYIIKNIHHMLRLRAAVRAALDHAAMRQRAYHLESRLHTLLTQLQVGAFSCTPDGQFLEVNPALQQMLRALNASRPDANLASFFQQPVEAGNFLRCLVGSDEPQQLESELLLPCETSVIYRINARRVAVAGEPLRIDGLLEDITHRKCEEIRERNASIARAQLACLSQREKQVFDEVVSGRMNKTIARRFDISEKTVERHRSNVMRKLNVRSVAELVRLATLTDNPPTE